MIGAPQLPPSALAAAVTPPGAVYVFDRVGDAWQKTAVLHAADAAQSDHFGVSLALADSTLAIGANGESGGATGLNGDARRTDARFSGAAYLFARSDDGTWKQSDYIKPANTNANFSFGWVVSLSEASLAIGAPAEDSSSSGINSKPGGTRSFSGAAYVFR